MKYTVIELTMGIERLCADCQQLPVKAHTRHLFQDPLLTRLGLYLPQNLSEEGP